MDVVCGVEQQRVVVKGHVARGERFDTPGDLLDHPLRRARAKAARRELVHGAVGAAVGAAPRGLHGGVALRAAQVVGRQKVAVTSRKGARLAGHLVHPVQGLRRPRPREHGIRARMPARVLCAQRGIDAAQGHGHVRPARLDAADGLNQAGVPVGHHRGDQGRVGARSGVELGLKDPDRQAIAPPAARDVGQGSGLGYLDLGELPAAVGIARRTGRWRVGIMAV